MQPKSDNSLPFACPTAPIGTRQPPSSLSTLSFVQLLSQPGLLCLPLSAVALSCQSLPSFATIAIAPCPAADGNCSSGKRSVISFVRFMRSSPASAMTIPCQLAFSDFADSCVNVASDWLNVQVGAHIFDFSQPPQTASSNDCALRQRC